MRTLRYTLSCANPQQRYIQFQLEIEVSEEVLVLQLPAWRPGRYELGNFAKNIKGFRVFNEKNERLAFEKKGKDTWHIRCGSSQHIRVEYAYYAAELNAGSSYLDERQLYVNPVNCFMWLDQEAENPISLQLEIPNKWKIASGHMFENNAAHFPNFDRLADSPFICSAQLEQRSYTVGATEFHICFNEQAFIPWERVLRDFEAFTKRQIEDFGEFPVASYTFLIQSLPYQAYHGVEHLDSTVITLGPSSEVFGSLYNELLGVSSHELYHAWNIKSIRPAEMLPYAFKHENYAKSGLVYEGITTYMGDLYLLKSGVFSLEQYLTEFSKQLQKHIDNPARFQYSVAESSYDTWLDGYVPGAPGRKVSIYTEGCLLAFATDIKIRKATQNKASLAQVMRILYYEVACQQKGYTLADYQALLENIAGISFADFFTDYVFGTASYEALLVEAFEDLGLRWKQEASSSYAEARLGMKVVATGQDWLISAIYPGSPADVGGLALNDLILGVNGMRSVPSLDTWLRYFEDQLKTLLVQRNGRLLEKTIPEVDRNFFVKNQVVAATELNHSQQKTLLSWKR
ncbi:MAG: hypothetical protein RLZZ301_705 [Bacteroidota bacterium]|jgi:predicted metalloprotease with PDZ domain